MIARKKWSEATQLVLDKDDQRTPQEVQKLLFYQNGKGYIPLNFSAFGNPYNMPPDALILKMMDIGGIKLIRLASNNGWTILHDVY